MLFVGDGHPTCWFASRSTAAAKLTVTQISAAWRKARRHDVLIRAVAIQQALRTERLGQADIVAGAYRPAAA